MPQAGGRHGPFSGKAELESMARAWERVANERERQLRNQIDIRSGFVAFPEMEVVAQ